MVLSESVKNSILTAALRAEGYDYGMAELQTRRALFARALRVRALGGHEAVLRLDGSVATLEQLAASINRQTSLQIGVSVNRWPRILYSVAGVTHSAFYDGGVEHLPGAPALPTPTAPFSDLGDELTDEHYAITRDAERLRATKNNVKAAFYLYFKDATTVEALAERHQHLSELLAGITC